MKKRLSVCKRIFAVAISFALLFAALVQGAGSYTLSDSEKEKIDGYKSRQEALDGDIANAQAAIDALADKIAEQEEYAAQMRAIIAAYQEKIDVINDTIAAYEAEIAEIQNVVDNLNAEIGDIEKNINHNNIEMLNSRHEIEDITQELQNSVRDVYVSGSMGPLEYLLACSDFSEYLIMLEMSANKAKHDEEIVDKIDEDIVRIEEINVQNESLIADLSVKRNECEENITQLEGVKAEQQGKRDELAATQSEYQALEDEAVAIINALDAESAAYQATIDRYEAQQAAMESEINNIIAAAQARAAAQAGAIDGSGGSPNFTGGFTWPLPYSDAYISSSYGYRTSPLTGSYSLHGGVDTCCYSGTLGKAVVAAAAGQVIYSSFNGYGNCIIIQHDSTFASLYGHLNSRAVGAGQYVSQGQVIGYAGNTYGPGGYSTGPHLHFEIRVNGAKANPLAYCSP